MNPSTAQGGAKAYSNMYTLLYTNFITLYCTPTIPHLLRALPLNPCDNYMCFRLLHTYTQQTSPSLSTTLSFLLLYHIRLPPPAACPPYCMHRSVGPCYLPWKLWPGSPSVINAPHLARAIQYNSFLSAFSTLILYVNFHESLATSE